MFSRLKGTIRILRYREPVVHGPDAVIVDRAEKPHTPKAGKAIAFLIEGAVCFYGIGLLAGYLGTVLFPRLHAMSRLSLATVAGALGAILLWLGHALVVQIQVLLKTRLNLAERLAPLFGHKIEETYRAIRG